MKNKPLNTKKIPSSTESVLDFLIKSKYFRLLKLFFDNPGKEFYVNEVKRETGLSPQIVCDELKTLEDKGFLDSIKRANVLFYSLKDNKYSADLRRLFF